MPPTAEAVAAEVSRQIEDDNLAHRLAAALPVDWALIGRCRTGTGTAGDQGGCFVLAHGGLGVALVDLAPCTTPDAELRLRRMLNLVDFAAEYRGYLPIAYCRIALDAIGGISRPLDAAFAYQPRLGIRQRTTWVAALRRVLRASGTWEAIGRPMPILSGNDEAEVGVRSKRLPVPRGTLMAAALLATFGAGLASGLLWVPPGVPPGAPQTGRVQLSAEANDAPGEAVARVAAPELGALPAWDRDGFAGPGTRAVPTLGPKPTFAPMPVLGPLPVFDLPAAPPLLSASVGGGAAARAEADPSAGLTGAVPQPVVSDSVPVAGVPPSRRMRDPMPIDRRCSDAVFRFQQGASLSQDEMAYVRRGCASWR